MNLHQQQLLQLLQIKPVQLYAGFEHFQPEHPSIVADDPHNTIAVEPPAAVAIQRFAQIPAEFKLLAADIQRAIEGCQPDLTWRWSAQLQQSVSVGPEIHSPDLALLTDPVQKQQLWQVIAQQTDLYETN